MNKILDVMEDIKQNITDNQYKILMESLMEINKEKGQEKKPLYYTQKQFDERSVQSMQESSISPFGIFSRYYLSEQSAKEVELIKDIVVRDYLFL